MLKCIFAVAILATIQTGSAAALKTGYAPGERA